MVGNEGKKETVLDKIDKRRLSNFGGFKDKLTEINKLKLTQNYQQSYFKERNIDDSYLAKGGKRRITGRPKPPIGKKEPN